MIVTVSVYWSFFLHQFNDFERKKTCSVNVSSGDCDIGGLAYQCMILRGICLTSALPAKLKAILFTPM